MIRLNGRDIAAERPKSESCSVTVLIAAYNAAPFLHRAVGSALDQTLAPLEVLIVDDGSTDNTAEVAVDIGQRDPRVRLIRLQRNGGPAVARNAGLQVARGSWIAVLDADDAIVPERLERLVRAGSRFGADVVLDNFCWYDSRTDAIGPPGIPASDAVDTVDRYEFVMRARPYTNQADWGLLQPMFRRGFLEQHGLTYPTSCRHGEDFLLMMDLLFAGAATILVRSPGYLYTTRNAGLSRTVVDYDTMAKMTANLLRARQVSADKRLKCLLRARVNALRRLSAERKLQSFVSAHDYRKIGRGVLADYWMARAVLGFGLRKVRSFLR